MNTQKLLIATVVSFVIMFGLGGLFHMGLLESWMKAHAPSGPDLSRTEPMLMYIALGVLLLSFIMSYLYPKGVEGDNKLMQGLKFGVIMGILWTIPFDLILYGSTYMFSLSQIGMDALANIIVQGLGGISIAYVYGMPMKKATV